MPASGVLVTEGERLPAGQRVIGQVDTGLFVGEATRGPADRTFELTSASDLDRWIGPAFGGGYLRRALNAFFADGGARAIISRAVDTTAVTAKATAPGSAGVVLNLEADGPGVWGNNLTLDISDGSTGRKLLVLKDTGTIVSSTEAASTAEAIGRLAKAGVVKVTTGPAAWPPTNTTSSIAFTGGASNDSAVTDQNAIDALAKFTRSAPPGTVMVPGRTNSVVHDALFRHGQLFGRHVLADLPDIADAPTLIAQAAGTRALDSEKAGRAGQLLWPWEVITIGPFLNVPIPPSAGQAGRMARVDRENPKRQARAAAGPQYVSRQAIGVTRVPTDADADKLAEAGITIIRQEPEGVCAMDAITVVDPVRWPQYYFAAGRRTRMAVVDQARAAVRQYLQTNIDGDGVQLGIYKGAVENACNPYSEDTPGGLYSQDGDHGYKVSITSSPTEIGQGRVRVRMSLRTTPSTRLIEIEFTAVAIGDTL